MKNGFDPPEWEVCAGAILTQNTNWRNVERALGNLKGGGIISPQDVMKTGGARLRELIRPSGFYRQKAGRLRTFAGFVIGFGNFREFSEKVTREQLLRVDGFGPETADSILLYALGRPEFVIDAYTRRVFTRLGRVEGGGYEGWKTFFESGLPEDVGIYREFHALIVELAKGFCRKGPVCAGCPVNGLCAGKKGG